MGWRGARRARHGDFSGAGRLNATPLPFEDSRRLTGPNLYFQSPGVVLETVGNGGDSSEDHARIRRWSEHVERACRALDWPVTDRVVRPHRGGAALAWPAPVDQLFCATEVNEWAWLAASHCHLLHAPGYPASWDEPSAMQTLIHMGRAEARPDLIALLDGATRHGIPTLLDDDQLSIGLGRHSQCWPLDQLPAADDVPWSALTSTPTALVTGSNGKTTTVRLLAAMLRAAGKHTAYSCTDGVFLDDATLESGDWSGPAGARAALRHPQAAAAVLETARGGILRRGLALDQVDAAIVTNISADHFGEYGIDDLDGLTDAKLVVARALKPGGVLVLNADDTQLLRMGEGLSRQLAWFSMDDAHPRLKAHRQTGGTTCGVANGRLLLTSGAERIDIGVVADMPLTAGGRAGYNIANLAGAALLAHALQIPADTIRNVFATFGQRHADNPGRLQRWTLQSTGTGGIDVLLDYAHNPEGLHGLLGIAAALRDEQAEGQPRGRLALILGQAGNRDDQAISDLARVALEFQPNRIVLKDLDGYMRGRHTGEIPELLQQQLRDMGYPEHQLSMQSSELDAARDTLQWARPGDVLVMPIHALPARAAVSALLDQLAQSEWTAGNPLPTAKP